MLFFCTLYSSEDLGKKSITVSTSIFSSKTVFTEH